jgi:hypothetical protein
MRTVRCVLALALVSAAAAGATAQVRLAELSGIVTDDSGGVLPGVTVTVTQVGTKNQRSDVTQASGTYFLAGLEPGVYEIRFELVGFTPVVFESTRLAIGQSQRVDTKLTVATIEETVRVVGEAPIVDTTKSTLSGRISQTQVE